MTSPVPLSDGGGSFLQPGLAGLLPEVGSHRGRQAAATSQGLSSGGQGLEKGGVHRALVRSVLRPWLTHVSSGLVSPAVKPEPASKWQGLVGHQPGHEGACVDKVSVQPAQ